MRTISDSGLFPRRLAAHPKPPQGESSVYTPRHPRLRTGLVCQSRITPLKSGETAFGSRVAGEEESPFLTKMSSGFGLGACGLFFHTSLPPVLRTFVVWGKRGNERKQLSPVSCCPQCFCSLNPPWFPRISHHGDQPEFRYTMRKANTVCLVSLNPPWLAVNLPLRLSRAPHLHWSR